MKVKSLADEPCLVKVNDWTKMESAENNVQITKTTNADELMVSFKKAKCAFLTFKNSRVFGYDFH